MPALSMRMTMAWLPIAPLWRATPSVKGYGFGIGLLIDTRFLHQSRQGEWDRAPAALVARRGLCFTLRGCFGSAPRNFFGVLSHIVALTLCWQAASGLDARSNQRSMPKDEIMWLL